MKRQTGLTAVLFLSLFFSFSGTKAQVYQWAKSMGGPLGDNESHIAIDATGNIYITGNFRDTVDFDPGPGIFNLISDFTYASIFISKLDVNGNFLWAKSIDGTSQIQSLSVTSDVSGNVYATGYFWGTLDFDPGPSTYNLIGSYTVFILKLNPGGNFIWADLIGGAGSYGYAITTDAYNNVYTTGTYINGADFDPGLSTYQLTSAGGGDIFVSKLDSNGAFVWARGMGGPLSTPQDDIGISIAVDGSGNVYTTGAFRGTADFDPGPGVYNKTSTGFADAFISKLDASGNFVWAKKIGGADNDEGDALAWDVNGNIYITGNFEGTVDFNPGGGTYSLVSGNNDAFILKLDASGNFVWAKRIGGTLTTDVKSIITDGDGNVYTTGGFTGSVDFDPGVATYNITTSLQTIFISKLDNSGNFVWAKGMSAPGPFGGGIGKSICTDAARNIYITGNFSSTMDFNPPFGSNLTSNGNYDIFVAKYSQPGGCSAAFSVYADTIPHNWVALNQSSGVAPINYLWSWGDSATSTGATPNHTYNTPGYYDICLNITDAAGCVSTYCDSSTYIYKGTNDNLMITINAVSPNSIAQYAGENKLIIFPNPVNSNITIQTREQLSFFEVTITNALGKQVSRKEFKNTASVNMNIEDGSGIYFVKVKSSGKTCIIKVVKL